MIRLVLVALLVLGGCKSEEKVEDTQPVEVATPEPNPEPPEVDPNLGDPDDPGTSEQLDLLAVAKGHFLEERDAEARATFEKLVKTGPVSAARVTAYVALGQLYRESGEEAKARKLYEELLALAPDVPEGHFMYGRVLAEMSETTQAIKAYETAIRLQPDYLQAYVELGGIYASAGRNDKAGETFLAYEERVYALAKRLESKDTPAEERLRVLDIFSFIEDERANKAIIVALKDPEAQIREQAVGLAEEFGIKEALPTLKTLSEDDPELRVRMAARGALDRMER